MKETRETLLKALQFSRGFNDFRFRLQNAQIAILDLRISLKSVLKCVVHFVQENQQTHDKIWRLNEMSQAFD